MWLQLPFDLALARGFPVCQTVIEYPGPGYQALMGRIQRITVHDVETDRTVKRGALLWTIGDRNQETS